MRHFLWFLTVFLIGFFPTRVIAYEFPQETIIVSGSDTVYIVGWIGSGIEEYFRSLDPTKIKRVHLFSNGGKLNNAFAIARIIRNNNIETYVGEEGKCFSACTVIFQAGIKRVAHSTAKFMYHYAYDRVGPTLETIKINERFSSIMFNTLIGYGISSLLIDRMQDNKGTDIYIDVIESLKYNITTQIEN